MIAQHENLTLRKLRARRHTVLLVAMIAMSVAQPMAQGLVVGLLIYDVLLMLVMLGVFAIVFDRWRERLMAFGIGLPAVVSQWVARGLSGQAASTAEVLHHGLLLVFFGFAVVVILRGVFEEKVIRADHFLGTVCGYLLAGAAWANAFVLAELMFPGSFSIKPEIAWQLEHDHTRSFLFNYFSLCTLTGAGYGDITPVGPGVASLTWLEAAFGQFYIAVIVAQLVGLKLAQAISNASERS